MPTKICKAVILLLFSIFAMASCATTVPVQVEQAPTLDTSGITRIAIMPFTASSDRYIYNRMARYITAAASKRIKALNNFSLVDQTVIEQLKERNENLEGYVDALLNGQVSNIRERVDSRDRQVLDRETGRYRTVFIRRREVQIEFNYYLTRVSDGSIIGPIFRSSTYSSDYTRREPPSSISLLQAIVDRQLRYLDRDIAPYTVTEKRSLAKESSKDKGLRALMKDAQSQVRDGAYYAALESYLGIYARYRNIPAALNASILQEALGSP